jgi:hypothetical protein
VGPRPCLQAGITCHVCLAHAAYSLPDSRRHSSHPSHSRAHTAPHTAVAHPVRRLTRAEPQTSAPAVVHKHKPSTLHSHACSTIRPLVAELHGAKRRYVKRSRCLTAPRQSQTLLAYLALQSSHGTAHCCRSPTQTPRIHSAQHASPRCSQQAQTLAQSRSLTPSGVLSKWCLTLCFCS